MARSGQQFIIAAGDHEATVVEVGAGLRRYTHRGVDVTAAYGEDDLPPKGCGAVLVPWPNRLRGGHYIFDGEPFQLALTEPLKGNAIHGLGRWVRWMPVRHERPSVTLRLDIVPQIGWPFEVGVEVTYALHPETGPAVSTAALNTGRGPAAVRRRASTPYLSTRGHALDDVTVQGAGARAADPGRGATARSACSRSRARRTTCAGGPKLRGLRLDDAFTELSHGGRPRGRRRADQAGWRARSGSTTPFGFVQVFTVDVLIGGSRRWPSSR